MSWGTSISGGLISSVVLDDLYNNYNMVLVAAAGNHNENPPLWPARYEKVIAVAGLNSYDQKLHDSPTDGSGYGPQIELCAAMAPITHAGNWNNSHYRFDGWGTSHSSPIVAGVAALVISELIDQGVTDYTNDLVRSILTYTADDVDYANEGQPWEGLLGSGRVNAFYALDLIQSPPAAPTLSISSPSGQHPTLSWVDGGEPDIDYFVLKKKYTNIGGTTYKYVETSSHSYTDPDFTVQKRGLTRADYWVKAIDYTDQSSPYSNQKTTYGLGPFPKQIVESERDFPARYSLAANHPNPFNPATIIRYDLPEASSISLVIYDVMGREVRRWEQQEPPGYRQEVWDGTDRRGKLVPAGIYIYRLVAASVESDKRFMASRKMLLLK